MNLGQPRASHRHHGRANDPSAHKRINSRAMPVGIAGRRRESNRSRRFTLFCAQTDRSALAVMSWLAARCHQIHQHLLKVPGSPCTKGSGSRSIHSEIFRGEADLEVLARCTIWFKDHERPLDRFPGVHRRSCADGGWHVSASWLFAAVSSVRPGRSLRTRSREHNHNAGQRFCSFVRDTAEPFVQAARAFRFLQQFRMENAGGSNRGRFPRVPSSRPMGSSTGRAALSRMRGRE